MATDTRAYVAKILDNKPVFIALTNTIMDPRDGGVGARKVETWTTALKEVYTLKEICYSKTESAAFTAASPIQTMRTLKGPDMFQLYNTKAKICFSLWHPTYLETTLELYFYDANENLEDRVTINTKDKTTAEIMEVIVSAWMLKKGIKEKPIMNKHDGLKYSIVL